MVLDHMTKVTANNQLSRGFSFYLHHAVVKATSIITKLCMVFDDSAKSSKRISLNDVQQVRPTVQEDLLSILIHFRMYRVVLSVKIEKMFRKY